MTFGPVIDPHEALALEGARFVDARPGPEGQRAYDASHLEGAVHADLESDLSGDKSTPARGGRHPLPPLDAFARTLSALGIGPESTVVVYDAQNGVNAAARFWWMLRAVGHERVAIADGGLRALEEAGGKTTSEAPATTAAPAYPVGSAWRLPTAGLEEVDRLRRDPGSVVIDVRARERYEGKSEPIDPVAGHIPGAINVPLTENLETNGKFKPPAELRRLYREILGGRSADRAIVHCGSGVTACLTLAALERAGLEGAALYVGSFGEWCRARPAEIGAKS
jgi:thiosulfate/3-mercaptopyruvate sulfurtransferase